MATNGYYKGDKFVDTGPEIHYEPRNTKDLKDAMPDFESNPEMARKILDRVIKENDNIINGG